MEKNGLVPALALLVLAASLVVFCGGLFLGASTHQVNRVIVAAFALAAGLAIFASLVGFWPAIVFPPLVVAVVAAIAGATAAAPAVPTDEIVIIIIVVVVAAFSLDWKTYRAVHFVEGAAMFGLIRFFPAIGWWSVFIGLAGLVIIGAPWAYQWRKAKLVPAKE